MAQATEGLPPQRTLAELKAEVQARADRNGYPLVGIKSEDAREALGKLTSLDRDQWAAAWSAIGDRYAAEAESLAASDPRRADAVFLKAWRVYSFARWPVPNSPGKQRAYERAIGMFSRHGALQDPPIEVWRIPFEGSEIITYRQLPKGKDSVPLVLAISGADSRKEDMAERFAPLLEHGIGFVALRFFTVYGPRQRPDLAIHKFARLITAGKPIPVFGDGSTARDYTYVTDTVQGVMACTGKTFGYEIINLGGHEVIKINDLIHLFESLTGRKAHIENYPPHPADLAANWADVGKARQMLSWKPVTGLNQGVGRLVDWYNRERTWARQILTP